MTSPEPKVSSGQGTPSRSILDGFATASDARPFIQENVYVILGHGRFQRMILMCATLCLTVLLLHVFAYRLIGRPVEHWCRPPKELVDMPLQEWKNVAIPILPNGRLSQCTVYEPPVPGEGGNERRVVSCNQWEYAGDRQEDSIVGAWDLVCGRRWLYTLSTSAYVASAMVIVPLAGITSDRQGRRPTILACSVTMLLASVAAGSSQVFAMFLLARCLVAGTTSATNLLLFIVLYEVTGNEHRTLYSILATSVGAAIATPLISIVSLAEPRWWLSHAFLVTATAMATVWCYLIEESPVWLIDTHKVRLAERVILYAASQNGIDLKKAKSTFRVLKKQLEKRDSATPTASTVSGSATSRFNSLAASVLVSWFGVTFAFYGTGLQEKATDGMWALSSFVVQVLLLVVAYNAIMKWGQRNALSMLLALLCVSSGLRAVVHKLNMASPWTSLARLVVDSSAAVAMAMNYCYTTEVFPTAIRSMGLCVSYAAGRAGALLATFIEPLTSDNLAAFDLVMTLLVLASATGIQWLPEIFVKKKAVEMERPAPLTDQQRKEALKASLGQGSEIDGTKSKRRKSRKKQGRSVTSPEVLTPTGTMSPGSPCSPGSDCLTSPRRTKHSKHNNGEMGSGLRSPSSAGPISK